MKETIEWMAPNNYPVQGELVLVSVVFAFDKRCVHVAYLDTHPAHDGWFWYTPDGQPVDSTVTAWAEMPKGPQ